MLLKGFHSLYPVFKDALNSDALTPLSTPHNLDHADDQNTNPTLDGKPNFHRM